MFCGIIAARLEVNFSLQFSYKFRIYPTPEQEDLILRTFGCCRFVYNYFLAERMAQYKTTGTYPTRFQQDKSLTGLKKERRWLKEVDSTALQCSVKSLDAAYNNFLRGVKHGSVSGYPRFKSKRKGRQSYTSKCVNQNIKIFDGFVQLPKLGLVQCRISRPVKGRVISATVSRNSSGRYFVALCCTDVEFEHLPAAGKSVGLDMGLKTFVTGSDGVQYANQKYFTKNKRKMARLQRQVSRKTRGSHRMQKAKLKLARFCEKLCNQRLDAVHKLSTHFVRNYDVIAIEDLDVFSMIRNTNLTREILDTSWYELRRQLSYKSDWYGRNLVVIDRFFPSSQLCSCCGARWSGVKDLSVRKWTCPSCGAVHDRDENAAKNILSEGLRLLA